MRAHAVLLLAMATAVQAFWPSFVAVKQSFCGRKEALTLCAFKGTADRRDHIRSQVALGGLGALLLAANPPQALADSTGKYSTKQTAKKRYLPRVRKGVAKFQALGETLENPEAIKAYNQYVEDSLAAALALYGSSTRIGELPDPKSRTVEKEAEDFVKEVNAMAKGGDVKASYEGAKTALAAYLAGTKLEPLGDPVYKDMDR
ncbi:hypothetical protein NSK_000171 [Nannochloropsis salina CCMP1776]|uniref:Photosystem II Psb31 protein domain-containing protein n=1 Tax=Nannochloropsis salina CCMP1776 TaxID=1027361 RepID=A0A4D9DAE3_9STRA|nr:hypothetical protein NSK_000171 [Nannochloropsis salina CCMP1776]|eukprot:TFJ88602.1 hypothetical protein NSK_000171 [Nannochloropsis salina CCMP1776]